MKVAPKDARPGPGRPRVRQLDAARLRRLYVDKGLSLRDTARALRVSKDTAARALAEAGIKRRPHTRASKLAAWTLADLRGRVTRHGLRATARELDVNFSTLRDYLARREGSK